MDSPTHVQVVCIGDELLRGETEDLNSRWIARRLAGIGLYLDRICVLGDSPGKIGGELREGLNFLTGGLGPTHDDVTRSAVAEALGLELAEHGEARGLVESVSDAEEHLRMARLPEGSRALENAVGVAPGFVVERGGVTVAALPGPPEEMRAVFDEAVEHLGLRGKPAYSEELRVTRHEGDLVPVLDEFVESFPSLKTGSYPDADGVRIRVEGKRRVVRRAVKWLKARL